jgi:hypothetical protein
MDLISGVAVVAPIVFATLLLVLKFVPGKSI